MLRLFLGATSVNDVLMSAGPGDLLSEARLVLAAATTIGLITPIAAALYALLACIALVHLHASQLQAFAPVVIAMALALLGPGAYSFDARIFGRRLMKFEPDDAGRI